MYDNIYSLSHQESASHRSKALFTLAPLEIHVVVLLLSKCLKRVYFILITIFLFLAHLVYEKVKKALTSDSLKKGIMKAFLYAQTDCLEGFHSVLNFFAPKIIAYSYLGMFCR